MILANRSHRIVLGVACLVAISLIMGWFVGRYIPMEPKTPVSDLSDVLAWDTGRVSEKIVEFEAGTTMVLPSLLQGDAYEYSDEIRSSMSDNAITGAKLQGLWEITCPSLDISVVEARTLAARSIYDLNQGSTPPGVVLDDAKTILVTVSLTNTSNETYSAWWRTLPTMTLWSSNLINGTDTLGAGIRLSTAISQFNKFVSSEDDLSGALLSIAPGETQELVLPFLIPRNTLVDQSGFEKLSPTSFCIQTANYDTGTIYRLWL